MMRTKTYEQRQGEWVKEHNVKPGDKAIVIRALHEDDPEWAGRWVKEMNECIGFIGTIQKINGGDIRVGRWYFPYYLLCKVKGDATATKKPADESSDIITLKPGQLYRVEVTPSSHKLSVRLERGMDVLMRDDDDDDWHREVFDHNDGDMEGPCYGAADGLFWYQCVPYKGNERILGTSNQPSVLGY